MKRFCTGLAVFIFMISVFSACGQEPSAAPPPDLEGTVPDVKEAAEEESEEAMDWAEYDALIAKIRKTGDYAAREVFLHQAEDILMETGAVLPLYYYNDIYMQKADVSNLYTNRYGHKYFMFAQTPDRTLRIQLGAEPEYLDPALVSAVDGTSILLNTFSGLFTYNENNELIPDVISDYTVSDDGMSYTFYLLPDLKWSDGSELNANDFVYAWNRAAASQTAADYGYLFDVIGRNEDGSLKLEASEDARALRVTLVSPCPYFTELCALPTYFPVKQSEVEAFEDWERNPDAWCEEAGFVTNGAYTVASWEHDKSITLSRNPNYHRAEEVRAKTVELMLSNDDRAVFEAYNEGQLDFIDSVPNDMLQKLFGRIDFKVVDNLGTCYLNFNVRSPLFAGKTVEQANAMRRAFALLIDRDYIVENIGQTGQIPANTFIPAKMSDGRGGIFKMNDDAYTYPDEAASGYFNPSYSEENVMQAIKLLESAGFSFDNGMLSADTPISLDYLTDEGSVYAELAQAVRQDLGNIGIKMNIRTVDRNTFLQERKAGNYDIARNGWIADFDNPINMLEMWTTESGNNDCQFGR